MATMGARCSGLPQESLCCKEQCPELTVPSCCSDPPLKRALPPLLLAQEVQDPVPSTQSTEGSMTEHEAREAAIPTQGGRPLVSSHCPGASHQPERDCP